MSNETSTRGIGSLSNNVFERRTSTGSGLFSFFDGGFAQSFCQIASITVKKLRNTNFISSRHVKRENTSLPVDVRRSKTLLVKLPNVSAETYMSLCGAKYRSRMPRNRITILDVKVITTLAIASF